MKHPVSGSRLAVVLYFGLGLLFAWLTSKGVQSLPTPDPATVTTVVTGAVTVLLAAGYTLFNWIHNRAADANRAALYPYDGKGAPTPPAGTYAEAQAAYDKLAAQNQTPAKS